jgi:hypothetical protein
MPGELTIRNLGDVVDLIMDGEPFATIHATGKRDPLAIAEEIKRRWDAAEWRDISTAPKNGTPVLLAHAQASFDGWWNEDRQAWVDGYTDPDGDLVAYAPTNWMPLPDPPESSRGQS